MTDVLVLQDLREALISAGWLPPEEVTKLKKVAALLDHFAAEKKEKLVTLRAEYAHLCLDPRFGGAPRTQANNVRRTVVLALIEELECYGH